MRIQVLMLAVFVGVAVAQAPTPTTAPSEAQADAQEAAADSTAAGKNEGANASKAAKGAKRVKGDLDPMTADLADLRKAGYTIKKHNGEKLYCRKDPEAGSRVRMNTFCLTREQLLQMQANTRDGMREMTRQSGAEGN